MNKSKKPEPISIQTLINEVYEDLKKNRLSKRDIQKILKSYEDIVTNHLYNGEVVSRKYGDISVKRISVNENLIKNRGYTFRLNDKISNEFKNSLIEKYEKEKDSYM